ncbi:hypothetical protein PGT21_006675 [Puccinia graminis f. sp. tritici]|uniref:Wax synthase domain-containing protein n=2 Tax=Puccinia graminis f. sp. tritici TaxID=56615 RepID=E3KA16_PUCGT|nr:uncharacterized protein PGTG_07250 [Puccinia graminis f. sp. tritici CRL 75-36-700-3]EFP80998.1 hypothetical protein PGTG_07250 [Puccinia graminis f. sp. tritici CRL 75-36-700-3]KAA1068943.1 hypothetical protein PGT21_006675 [Puccinia graminis f. sp. tritici]
MLDYLRTILANDPLIKTYTNPYEVVPCRSVTVFSLLYLLPGLLQAGLLYPHLSGLRWVRWLRLLMTPVSVYSSLRLPVDYCFTPTTRRGYPNLALACACFTMAARSIQWGYLHSFVDGKIWKRPGFESPNHPQPPSPSGSTQLAEKNQPEETPPSVSFSDWLAWTIELTSSPRGIQYGWGVKAAPNTESAMDVIVRMYKLNLVHVMATSFSILCRDEGSATNALRYMGLGGFYGETIVAEGLASLGFGYYLVSMIELIFSYMTLFIHLLHLIDRRLLRLPEWLIRSCDLRTCVPMFNSPHTSPSLAHLWGKAWHQNFRQSFLICGGTPASKIAKALRLGPQLQRLAGMWACFLISAILHEYAIHFIARQPHPSPHILFHDFPGSAIYFLLQPIGVIVEPFLLPYIPGGGVVWCYLFTLITTVPFRRQYFMPARLLDLSYPALNPRWFISSLLIPGFTSRG